MSDDDLLGYVEYHPDNDEMEVVDRTLCRDCADDHSPRDGHQWATVRESPVFGAGVPRPVCDDCGDRMYPPNATFTGMS